MNEMVHERVYDMCHESLQQVACHATSDATFRSCHVHEQVVHVT